jgi:chromosome segregation ATPase
MTGDEYRDLVEFLGRQFAAIDQRFAAIDQRFAAIDERFVALEQRFDRLERRVEEGFREILGHLDAIYKRLERLEQEYVVMVEQLRRIELMLADERGRRQILERGLAELKERVTLLQARIDEVERRLRT